MYTLGINAVFHDSAAALVKDGHIIAASEEERFTHIKHGKRPIPFSAYELPYYAINDCLRQAGIRLTDVGHIAYSFDPAIPQKSAPMENVRLDYVRHAPQFLVDNVPHHLQERFQGAHSNRPYQWHFVEHHTAHAASAYLASPFDRAAVLTLDGRGEIATTSYSFGAGNTLERLNQVNLPHSLGLLYEKITRYLGFQHSSDEYKVMALASFGRPAFVREFRDMIRLKENGQFEIMDLNLDDVFGPARARGTPMEPRHFNIAQSLQKVLEETVLELTQWFHAQARDIDNLCLAGGVALNCVMNARIRDQGFYRQVWVQPAAGDAGTALGAALWVDAQQRHGQTLAHDAMDHAFWGPSYKEREIETFLTWTKVPFRRMKNPALEVAHLLIQDKIIGWYQGRMEFGPRALGARSILASPLHPEMQARLNDLKDREDFRPVAPVVLEEEAHRWFKNVNVSPFMLFIFDVLPEKADLIPAVRHTDGTARVQTINRSQNAPYYDLLKAFQAQTGVPVLINTSFNTRGEPMVCTPRDATECFWTSPLDALAIGPFLLEKKSTLRRRTAARKSNGLEPMGGVVTTRS